MFNTCVVIILIVWLLCVVSLFQTNSKVVPIVPSISEGVIAKTALNSVETNENEVDNKSEVASSTINVVVPIIKTYIKETTHEVVTQVQPPVARSAPLSMVAIGVFKVSGFSSSSKSIMSNYKGVTVAVDNTVIPYGTKIWIKGVGIRQAQPSSEVVIGKEIHVYFPQETMSVNFGTKDLEVYIIK